VPLVASAAKKSVFRYLVADPMDVKDVTDPPIDVPIPGQIDLPPPAVVCCYRERAVLEALRVHLPRAGEVAVRDLAVGDFAVGGGGPPLLVERKTPTDLLQSLQDGRWSEQRERLLRAREEEGSGVLYVVEGEDRSTGAQRQRVLGAQAGLALRGIPMLATRTAAETAWVLQRLSARRAAASDAPPRPPGGRKRARATREEAFRAMLCQCPGVSAGTAAAIAGRYPTMAAVLDAARAGALRGVPGVGPARARSILAVLGC